jgi:16S rRNA (adenine1518-N6/adenine1519-N6)-dimethyltransferase
MVFETLIPAFIPKKRLGQNFLVDKRAISRIVDACELSQDEVILEIGPGQGALTRVLLPCVKGIVAVEADRTLAERLRMDFEGRELIVHQDDILKIDLSKIPGPLKVVGNIPYNISTPIIARILENRAMFTSLFMTLQYEFGARLVAKPGSKDYSSLSCFVQMFAEPKLLFKIPPAAFRPMPKVTSCFMRLDVRREPAEMVEDEAAFVTVVRQAFQQRRKNLLNSLSPLCPKDEVAGILEQAKVDPQARAGDLTIAEYARISNGYYKQKDLLSRH